MFKKRCEVWLRYAYSYILIKFNVADHIWIPAFKNKIQNRLKRKHDKENQYLCYVTFSICFQQSTTRRSFGENFFHIYFQGFFHPSQTPFVISMTIDFLHCNVFIPLDYFLFIFIYILYLCNQNKLNPVEMILHGCTKTWQ